MALLDMDRKLITVRIVYDGPALSGKTTSLRALARSLGCSVASGDEAEGRTLYFDWLDYTGGRFEGCPIRCQVVSVPGQQLLSARREFLLSSADAVVFVADSRRSGLESSARMLEALRALLRQGIEPRPGVIVQANKRDAPDAAELTEVRLAMAGGGALAITESTATEGAGLRETFVLAVRLALDRVIELRRRSALPSGRPVADSAEALLEMLREAEIASERQAPAEPVDGFHIGSVIHDAVAADAACAAAVTSRSGGDDEERRRAAEQARPPLPDAAVPGGMIWPPVEGRLALHEAAAEDHTLEQAADGSWTTIRGRWRLHSYREDVFLDAVSARAALIEWARWHANEEGGISPRRCILAAGMGNDAWRIWQAVRGEQTIRLALRQVLALTDPDRLAGGLVDLSLAFIASVKRWDARGLPCSIDTVGLMESGPAYLGLAPRLSACPEPGTGRDRDSIARLKREFGPIIAEGAPRLAVNVPRMLRRLMPLAASHGQAPVGEALAAMLIGR